MLSAISGRASRVVIRLSLFRYTAHVRIGDRRSSHSLLCLILAVSAPERHECALSQCPVGNARVFLAVK